MGKRKRGPQTRSMSILKEKQRSPRGKRTSLKIVNKSLSGKSTKRRLMMLKSPPGAPKKKQKIADKCENDTIIILSDDEESQPSSSATSTIVSSGDILRFNDPLLSAPILYRETNRKSSLRRITNKPLARRKSLLRKTNVSQPAKKTKRSGESNEVQFTDNDDIEVLWSSENMNNNPKPVTNSNKKNTKVKEKVLKKKTIKVVDKSQSSRIAHLDIVNNEQHTSPSIISPAIATQEFLGDNSVIELSSNINKSNDKPLAFFVDTQGDPGNITIFKTLRDGESLLPPVLTVDEETQSTSQKKTSRSKKGENSKSTKDKEIKLREIVVDGCNVAMCHKNGNGFSERGLELVLDYFVRKGHKVTIFLPQHKRRKDRLVIEELHRSGIVVFTPSRVAGNKKITPYDDRFILDYATQCGGIIVSSDQYRDLFYEKPQWAETIENRLIAPTFVGDYVMFPEDPLGRKGPRLEEFLQHL